MEDIFKQLREKHRATHVVTFLGYTGQHSVEALQKLHELAEIALSKFEHQKERTIVNFCACTCVGIGTVCEIAHRKGFITTGIVTGQEQRTECPTADGIVDYLVRVTNAEQTGGGRWRTNKLDPVSEATVRVSDWIIALGGGAVVSDMLSVAIERGKEVISLDTKLGFRGKSSQAYKEMYKKHRSHTKTEKEMKNFNIDGDNAPKSFFPNLFKKPRIDNARGPEINDATAKKYIIDNDVVPTHTDYDSE